MRNILRFIKWQWKRVDSDERKIILICLVTIALTTASILMNAGIMHSLIAIGIGSLCIQAGIWYACHLVYVRWLKFLQHQQYEEEAIIRKLKGER